MKKNKSLANTNQNKNFELILSLSYYLNLFTSLKRFLEYVSLISNYYIKQEFSLLIPLDDKGRIWLDNICFSDKKLRNQAISDSQEFFKDNGFINNFKLNEFFLSYIIPLSILLN